MSGHGHCANQLIKWQLGAPWRGIHPTPPTIQTGKETTLQKQIPRLLMTDRLSSPNQINSKELNFLSWFPISLPAACQRRIRSTPLLHMCSLLWLLRFPDTCGNTITSGTKQLCNDQWNYANYSGWQHAYSPLVIVIKVVARAPAPRDYGKYNKPLFATCQKLGVTAECKNGQIQVFQWLSML